MLFLWFIELCWKGTKVLKIHFLVHSQMKWMEVEQSKLHWMGGIKVFIFQIINRITSTLSTSFQFCLSDTLLETLLAEFDVVIEQAATGLTLSPSLEGCRYLRWAGRYNVSISPQLRCHTPKLGSPWQSRPTPMDSTWSTQEGEKREILRKWTCWPHCIGTLKRSPNSRVSNLWKVCSLQNLPPSLALASNLRFISDLVSVH